MAQAAVGRMCDISRRLSQILDVRRSRATRIWKPAMVLLVGFSAGSILYEEHVPELVAFQDPVITASVAPVAVKPTLASYSVERNRAAGVDVKRVRVKITKAKVHAKAPLLMEAKFHPRVVHAAPEASATYVVFEQYGQRNVVWTLCVWRVTVITVPQTALPASKI
jgi:hypothetical protein